jgi:hypothetical protein
MCAGDRKGGSGKTIVDQGSERLFARCNVGFVVDEIALFAGGPIGRSPCFEAGAVYRMCRCIETAVAERARALVTGLFLLCFEDSTVCCLEPVKGRGDPPPLDGVVRDRLAVHSLVVCRCSQKTHDLSMTPVSHLFNSRAEQSV